MHPHSTEEIAGRFWAKVHKSDSCWLWQGTPCNSGYGEFGFNGARWLTHRLAYTLAYGPIPAGLCVLHRCDANYPLRDITYRLCCRPDHLFLGTRADNAADRDAKGRCVWDHPVRGDQHYHRLRPETVRRGERHPVAKLDETAVREIRRLRSVEGLTYRQIAARFDVDLTNIACIVKRKTWAHIV